MKFQLFSTDQPDKITRAVMYAALVSFFILFLASPVNNFLKTKYGKFSNKIVCELIWKIPESYQFLFFQICKTTEDYHLTPEEFAATVINSLKNGKIKNELKLAAAQSEDYRKQFVSHAVEYGIESYKRRIRSNKYVDTDKPTGYFQDIYQSNKYNKEQQVLLEQAKYTEYNSDNSYAQKILGPKRELSYVGLKFPYGSGLTE